MESTDKRSKFFRIATYLYKENGFKEKTTAQALIRALEENGPANSNDEIAKNNNGHKYCIRRYKQ
ncbi:hypothetical protein [Eubacterium sp.]|uniref:hypothetical protein n=1 Tax=Eubacterium sp. TaxID=142586 RepID=UPI003520145C